MAENPNVSVQFASCFWKVQVVEAMFCLILAATALAFPRGWLVGGVLFLGAVWSVVQARRDRSRPYVEVSNGWVTIYNARAVGQRFEMRVVSEVCRGWNRTILVLNDGSKVGIHHTGFATGEEAERFRQFMEQVKS